jgi:hypothetical protein
MWREGGAEQRVEEQGRSVVAWRDGAAACAAEEAESDREREEEEGRQERRAVDKDKGACGRVGSRRVVGARPSSSGRPDCILSIIWSRS